MGDKINSLTNHLLPWQKGILKPPPVCCMLFILSRDVTVSLATESHSLFLLYIILRNGSWFNIGPCDLPKYKLFESVTFLIQLCLLQMSDTETLLISDWVKWLFNLLLIYKEYKAQDYPWNLTEKPKNVLPRNSAQLLWPFENIFLRSF